MFNKYLDEENPIFTTKEFTTLLEQKTYKHLDYPLSEFTTLFFHKRPDFKYIRELGMDHLCKGHKIKSILLNASYRFHSSIW